MIAKRLKHMDGKAYDTLSRRKLYHHASGTKGVSIRSSLGSPTLLHDAQTEELVQVRWNNADRAGFSGDFQGMQDWYEAAR